MKLDEMKVQYDKSRDGFTHESSFEVRREKPLPKINVNGIAVKVGLCAGVLALAFIVRAFGVGVPKETSVAEVASHSDGTGEQQNEQQPGTLKYVEASAGKWTAPVRSTDIELMREGLLLRFTAGASEVSNCMDGRVLSVGTDDTLGEYVRVQSETDCEAIYYGFDKVSVKEGDSLKAGDSLGTIPLGRSLYMKVYQNGAPQDPTAFVDLSLNRK